MCVRNLQLRNAIVNEQMSHTGDVFRNQRSVLLIAMVQCTYAHNKTLIDRRHVCDTKLLNLASSLIFRKLVMGLTGCAILLAFYSFDQLLC